VVLLVVLVVVVVMSQSIHRQNLAPLTALHFSGMVAETIVHHYHL
jgi:hypothetical protein